MTPVDENGIRACLPMGSASRLTSLLETSPPKLSKARSLRLGCAGRCASFCCGVVSSHVTPCRSWSLVSCYDYFVCPAFAGCCSLPVTPEVASSSLVGSATLSRFLTTCFKRFSRGQSCPSDLMESAGSSYRRVLRSCRPELPLAVAASRGRAVPRPKNSLAPSAAGGQR